MVELNAALSLPGVKEAATNVGKQLLALGKDKFQGQLKRWLSSAKIESASKQLRQITLVKTLWSFDKPTSLYAFYYPARIIFPSGIEKQPTSIKELAVGKNVVIQGTVGQGKSIFLRYLCAQEVRASTASGRLPVFVELRRVQGSATIKDVIFGALTHLNFDIDEEFFKFLANSGKLVLLLDAFDEMDPDCVSSSISYLESLHVSFPSLQVVITSRPESGVQQIPHFDVLKLAPLNSADHKPFLGKICSDLKQVLRITDAINASANEVHELLETPLLLTLLVVLYKVTSVIPNTVPEFYDQLFDVLFLRHDRSKPGFSRERRTKLSDAELKSVFEKFCFQARKTGKNTFSSDDFSSCLTAAVGKTPLEIDAEAFKDEMTKTACLMQAEGFELTFIHKSVAEFHAATFIKHAPEQVGKQFYEGIPTLKRWNRWMQELKFLSTIDVFRYNRYFLISALDKVLKEVLPASETSFDNFLNQWCILQKNSLFGRVSSGADSLNFFSLPEQPRNSFGFIEFNSIFAESLFDFAKGVDRETFTQLEKLVITGDNFENVGRNVCLRSAQTIPKIRSGTFTAFVQAIHLIENKRDAAVEFVETELEKVDLFKGIFSTV